MLVGLVGLLVLALALVVLATSQLHKRHLQQTVADETRRHAQWIAQLDESEEREQAVAALQAQREILHIGPVTEELTSHLEGDQSIWIADFEGQPAMWAVDEGSSQMVVVLSLADAQSAIDAGRGALMLYLAITLLFVTLVGYGFFSFVVIRPLRALGVATERAAKGDLASPISLMPRNEFGDVARQFNRMLETLNAQREELEEQLEQIETAHRELKQTQESLIRSEKMASVGHLAAGVAHEVGNPLAAVMGYTELLRDRDVDEESADDIAERTLVQLKRIRQTIRQLLDYSRADSETEPTAVELAGVIDEAVHLVEATPEGRQVDVELEIADNLPPVHAIAGELEQVLVNLFLNAVKAMHDEGTPSKLFIGADIDGDHVAVDIRDTGPGIEPALADQIFDPFFTTRQPGEGTGLGLAIAQRLVARADGELTLCDSDDGAHFRIRLRRHSPKTSRSAVSASSSRSSTSK